MSVDSLSGRAEGLHKDMKNDNLWYFMNPQIKQLKMMLLERISNKNHDILNSRIANRHSVARLT